MYSLTASSDMLCSNNNIHPPQLNLIGHSTCAVALDSQHTYQHSQMSFKTRREPRTALVWTHKLLKNLKTPFFQDIQNSFQWVTGKGLEPHQNLFQKKIPTNTVARAVQSFG